MSPTTTKYPPDGYATCERGAVVFGYKIASDAMLVASVTDRQCDHTCNLGSAVHDFCPFCGRRNRVDLVAPVAGFEEVCRGCAYTLLQRWHCVRCNNCSGDDCFVVVIAATEVRPLGELTELPMPAAGATTMTTRLDDLRAALTCAGLEWDPYRIGVYVLPPNSILPRDSAV